MVLPHRHVGRLVKQNIGRHQHRIRIEPEHRLIAFFAGLLLELGHSIKPAKRRHAIQQPSQLSMLRHAALVENDALLRIETRSQQTCSHLASAGAQGRRILLDGNGMEVNNAVDAVIFLLHRDPILDGAEIISKVQITGRLHTGEHAFHASGPLLRNIICRQ